MNEWWYSAGPGVQHDLYIPGRPASCGGAVSGRLNMRVYVPRDTKVKLMIPRNYKMGEGAGIANSLSNLAKIMNQNVKSYSDCEALSTVAGSNNLTGAICIDPYDTDRAGLVWVDALSEGAGGDASAGDAGTATKFPSQAYDGGTLNNGLWPYHTIFYIESFKTWKGSVPFIGGIEGGSKFWDSLETDPEFEELYTSSQNCLDKCDSENDCSNYNNNQALKKSCETSLNICKGECLSKENLQELQNKINTDLNVHENSFPDMTIAELKLLSNGREGEGDPYYIAIQVDNIKYKTNDEGDAKNYFSEKGFDGTGTAWDDTKIDGWEQLANDEHALKFPNVHFKKWYNQATHRSGDWGNTIPVVGQYAGWLVGLFEGIFGKRPKVCVFGCSGATVEFELKFTQMSINRNLREELIGSNFNPRTDAYVCDIHADSSEIITEQNLLPDGYKYSCEYGTGAYIRSDYRISCTSRMDPTCRVVSDSDSPIGGQTLYSNPIQVRGDLERTRENYLEEFRNPKVPERIAGETQEEGVQLGYDFIMRDFDPDYSKNICEASNCLSSWFNKTNIINEKNLGKKIDPRGKEVEDMNFLFSGSTEGSVYAHIYYDGPYQSSVSIFDKNDNLVASSSSVESTSVMKGMSYKVKFPLTGVHYQSAAYALINGHKCTIMTVGGTGAFGGYFNNNGEPAKCYEFNPKAKVQTHNFCCGDDPEDIGFMQVFDGVYYGCFQNPDGSYEWVASNGTSHKGSFSGKQIKGNIYDVFDDDFYSVKMKKITDDKGKVSYKRVYPWEQKKMSPVESYLSVGNDGWVVCTNDDDFKFRGATSSKDKKLKKVGLGETITIPTSSGDHEYLCYEENGGARFSECFDNVPLNNLDVIRTKKYSGFNWWSSYSASHSNAIVRVGSFEDGIKQYEDWENKGDDGKLISQRKGAIFTENKKSLSIIYKKVKGDSSVVTTSSIRLPVTKWTGFKYLEGQFKFDKTPALNLNINGIKYKIDDYVTSELKSNEWNYFRIPIWKDNKIKHEFINGKPLTHYIFDPVEKIEFEIDPSQFSFNDEGDYVFYIDNLNLIKGDGLKYCGGDNSGSTWVEDRDDSEKSCNEKLGLSYTGKKCCGDDGIEYYNDKTSGCWMSENIENGERFQVVDLSILEKNFRFICSEGDKIGTSVCRKDLPRIENKITEGKDITIKSDSDSYNVSFSDYESKTHSSLDDIYLHLNRWDYVLNGGVFEYCGPENSKVNSYLDELKSKTSTSDLKVRKIEFGPDGSSCSFTKDYYCSPSRGWTNYNQKDNIEKRDDNSLIGRNRDGSGDIPKIHERTILSYIPEKDWIDSETLVQSECCPEYYCWSGKKCIEDQSDEPWKSPTFIDPSTNDGDGFRCVFGKWEYSYRKFSPEGDVSGYCEKENQCFVSDFGDYEDNDLTGNNPQCVNSGVYFGDYYCDKGDWTSRTKMLATSFAKKGGSSYEVYCDNYKNVVNYAKEVFGKDLSSFFSNKRSNSCSIEIQSLSKKIDCVNNFCLLSKGDKIAFGTSLNQEIDAENKSMVELFNDFGIKNKRTLASKINSAKKTPDRFNMIIKNQGGYWYYEPTNKILVFSEFTLDSKLYDRIASFFKTFFNWILNKNDGSNDLFSIDGLNSISDLSFLKHNKAYNVVYLNTKQKKQRVVSFKGKKYDLNSGHNVDFIVGNFRFFKTDLCNDYFNEYNKHMYSSNKISCSKSGNDYFVFVFGDDGIWQDISSKLRVS